MVPITSTDQRPGQKHLLEMPEILHEVGVEDGVVVEEGDERVLRVPADVDDLAPLCEQILRQQTHWQVSLDDSRKVKK